MLLYRAAQEGAFGRVTRFERGGITDALFVYLDGEPEPESAQALAAGYLARPWVCLTGAWESRIRERFQRAQVYVRTLMRPARRFSLPEQGPLPEGCRLAAMDEAAFNAHPFGHGANYPSYEAFQADGSGAVVRRDGEIVASASSFISGVGGLSGAASVSDASSGTGRGSGM